MKWKIIAGFLLLIITGEMYLLAKPSALPKWISKKIYVDTATLKPELFYFKFKADTAFIRNDTFFFAVKRQAKNGLIWVNKYVPKK